MYNEIVFSLPKKKLLIISCILLAYFVLVPIAHTLPHDHAHDVSEVGGAIGHPLFYYKIVAILPLFTLIFLRINLPDSSSGVAIKLVWLSRRALFIDDPNKSMLASGVMHLNER